jgi:anaerobic selenocysteine-containing dehydrogenase
LERISSNKAASAREFRSKQAARLYMKSKRVITCWAMGLTQHKNAVGTIQEIVNLHLLRGNIGREGAGLCPVRGHSNVQGDRTVGIWERPREEFLQALDQRIQLYRAASSRLRYGRSDQSYARRARQSFLRARRQFSVGDARH